MVYRSNKIKILNGLTHSWFGLNPALRLLSTRAIITIMAVITTRSTAAITPAMMATGIAVDIPFSGPTGTVKK